MVRRNFRNSVWRRWRGRRCPIALPVNTSSAANNVAVPALAKVIEQLAYYFGDIRLAPCWGTARRGRIGTALKPSGLVSPRAGRIDRENDPTREGRQPAHHSPPRP